jgi:hypothetical protein
MIPDECPYCKSIISMRHANRSVTFECGTTYTETFSGGHLGANQVQSKACQKIMFLQGCLERSHKQACDLLYVVSSRVALDYVHPVTAKAVNQYLVLDKETHSTRSNILSAAQIKMQCTKDPIIWST